MGARHTPLPSLFDVFKEAQGCPAPRTRVVRLAGRRAAKKPSLKTAGLSDRALWVAEKLDAYVAAIYTAKPRRSEAKKLREQMHAILEREGRMNAEAVQLEEEALALDTRAALHEQRAERIRLDITARVM